MASPPGLRGRADDGRPGGARLYHRAVASELIWLNRPAVAPSVSELGAKAHNLVRLCDALIASTTERRLEARAEADVKAGRLISHEAVRRWLSSWGSAKRLPRPRVGD